MPTIIAKRIRAKTKNLESNETRASNLIHYITTEIDQKGMPKCTEIRTKGFPDNDYSVNEIIHEVQIDMEKPRLHSHELLTHWVISWKGMDPPNHDKAFEAAKKLMSDLGYTRDHKQVFTIHENTDNVHIHVAACKVNQWTGRILNEGNGWFKNAAQKSLVNIAEEFGWELEPHHHFTKPKKPKKQPNDRTKSKDKHTREISEQGKITEILTNFVEEHEEDFGRWKFGHFHSELAHLGVECKRTEARPGIYGIAFSLDGKNFCSATNVCREMTYTKLLEKIGAKSWRDARPEIKEILEETRRKAIIAEKPKIQPQKTDINKDWWKFKEKPTEIYVNVNEIIGKKYGGNYDQRGSQTRDRQSMGSRISRKIRIR